MWGIMNPEVYLVLFADRYLPAARYMCDAWMTYRQAGRLTDTLRPSFCASEHLTDKVGNPVEAGLMVWKDSTLLGHSKVFRAHIDTRLCHYP